MDQARRVTNLKMRIVAEGFARERLTHRIRLQATKAADLAFTDGEAGSLSIADQVPDVPPGSDLTYAKLLAVAINREKAAFRTNTNLASVARTGGSRDAPLQPAQEEAQHRLRFEIKDDLATF